MGVDASTLWRGSGHTTYERGTKMMLLAFKDEGRHLAMGHPEAKLLFLSCKLLLCCVSPCPPPHGLKADILLSTYSKRSTHKQHVRHLIASQKPRHKVQVTSWGHHSRGAAPVKNLIGIIFTAFCVLTAVPPCSLRSALTGNEMLLVFL